MRRLVIVLAAIGCGLCAGRAMGAVTSGPIANPANGHQYFLLSANTWTASRAEAVALGGHLATINDAAEQAWIYSTFSQFGGVNRNLWIGLFDPLPTNSLDRAVRRTEFRWVSGQTSSYTNWSPFEPNSEFSADPVPTPEYYVHIWNPTDPFAGQWNNFANGTSLFDIPLHGVVERVPEPVAASLATWCMLGVACRRRCGTA